ncbi:Calcium-transporting ATPase 9 [Abeliophyllum distichum]|uniref:Calcium-transporting ATPase 9 n=1 Tax=Abeliophyllum distichum TaxID=126358 RepID=A0ABD1V7T8_9LAMI
MKVQDHSILFELKVLRWIGCGHVGNFDVSLEELVSMSKEPDLSLLEQQGGVKGVADKVKSNLEQSVPGDETVIINRTQAFGSNTYPRKKGRSFWFRLHSYCVHSVLLHGILIKSNPYDDVE